MSKFNTPKERKTVTNYVGAKAYKRTAKVDLVNAVVSSFMEDSYYEKAEKRVSRVSELVKKVAEKDPVFVAKLAIFTRDSMNMRSSFHVLVGELAKHHKGDSLVADLMAHAARPDDLTEIVAYVGKPIPNQVKKGVVRALAGFDAYQLGKYQGKGKDFTLRDLVRLTHPNPHFPRGRVRLMKSLAEGTLRNTETWESQLSAGGDKTEVFKDLLKNKKLGYMAALRNLRNILQTGDQELISMVARYISNPTAIKNSRQLPFRFLSAYEAVVESSLSGNRHTITFEKDDEGTDDIVEAITIALEKSVENIPLLPGKTFILADNSGSMGGDSGGSSAVSAHSARTTASIANLFAVLYWTRANNTAIGLFGDRLVQPKLDREANIFDNYQTIRTAAATTGMATEQGIFDAINGLINGKQKVDRIVIFSDMQIGGNHWFGSKAGTNGGTFSSLFQQYKKMFPDVKVFSVNLKGYGTTVFGTDVIELAGWSDKIFDIMNLAEQDKNALVTEIEAVEL